MRLEICNNTAEAIKTAVISCAVAGIILGIAYMIYDMNAKSTYAIAHAPTCEQAVILTGTDVSNRLIGCKIQPQTLQTGVKQ